MVLLIHSLAALAASLVTCASVTSADDVFSSVSSMKYMLSRKEAYLDLVKQYIEQEKAKLLRVQRAIEDFKSVVPYDLTVNETREPTPEEVATANHKLDHPVTAYKIVTRWVALSQALMDNSPQNEFRDSLAQDGLVVPTIQDRLGSADGLLRLQRIYNISVDDMGDGMIQDRMGLPLEPRDFYDIGVRAAQNKDWGLTAQWMEKALVETDDVHFLHKDAHSWVAKSLYFIGDYHRAQEAFNKALMLDPLNWTMREAIPDFAIKDRELLLDHGGVPKATPLTWKRDLTQEKLNYELLCNGETPMTSVTHLGVMCRMRPTDNPYLRYKEEIFSRDPYVSVIYDVITDKEAKTLKNLARPQLNRAVVGGGAVVSDIRVSKVAWLSDNNNSTKVLQLSRRVARITGLDTDRLPSIQQGEDFQVVNYGIGGHYAPHLDPHLGMKNVPAKLRRAGDRVATFLFYLNDVEAGGATVFPRIGVVVPPVKNSAAFWYNMQRSGDVNQGSLHAGCPVLLGEKWVINKWIREYGSYRNRKCGRTRHALDEL